MGLRSQSRQRPARRRRTSAQGILAHAACDTPAVLAIGDAAERASHPNPLRFDRTISAISEEK